MAVWIELVKAGFSVIPAIITAITAIYIYRQWYNQKGSEVVANEAKEAIKNLLEADKILNYMFSTKLSYLEAKEEYNKYSEIKFEQDKSLLFLADSVSNNNLKRKLEPFLENEYELASLFIRFHQDSEQGLDVELIISDMLRLLNENRKLRESVNKAISPLATYREMAKFIK